MDQLRMKTEMKLCMNAGMLPGFSCDAWRPHIGTKAFILPKRHVYVEALSGTRQTTNNL